MRGDPMKSKAQAAIVISQQLQALQVLLSRPPKRLHTDGAREKQVPQLAKSLRDQDTQLTTTAPNYSAQNGLVKRCFRTIFAAIRSALVDCTLGKEFWTHAALDAIDKATYTPTRRVDAFPPPNAQCSRAI